MNPRPVYLAICNACSAHPAPSMYATEVPQQQPFYCTRCRPGLMTGEEQIAQPGAMFSFVDGWDGASWYVAEMHEDGFFTAAYVGVPGIAHQRRHVSEIRAKFSYAKLEASRRGQPC